MSCASRKIISSILIFHHEFELIHPFLDGNGKIGHVLASEQLTLLFGQRVFFDPDRNDCYQALGLMNMGQGDRLSELICEQLEESNLQI